MPYLITPCDINGNSLIDLVQWDKNIYIYLKDTNITQVYPVHFFNKLSDEALVVNSVDFIDDSLKVKIPNILLTQPYTINGYINVINNDTSRCIYSFQIAIKKKPKPSDFIFVESDDYITLESILEECKTHSQIAKESSDAAKVSETNAKASETNAKASETNTKASEQAALESASSASDSASAAAQKAADASDSANESKSYAIGGTGIRTNEDTDNAKYYYSESLRIAQSLNGAILPMGTITFSELLSATKRTGYMYNISDDFISDPSFKDGGGHQYAAGTNVYYTADGYWDCLTGAMVTGIKGESESDYHRGNVNITKESIGLGNVPNVNTNDQIPTFNEAGARTNISSGETLSVILGKIKKFFSDLKPVAFSGSYSDLSGRPSIVNNITTTTTGSVLDASQGKVLNDKYVAVNNLLTDSVTQADIDALF